MADLLRTKPIFASSTMPRHNSFWLRPPEIFNSSVSSLLPRSCGVKVTATSSESAAAMTAETGSTWKHGLRQIQRTSVSALPGLERVMYSVVDDSRLSGVKLKFTSGLEKSMEMGTFQLWLIK